MLSGSQLASGETSAPHFKTYWDTHTFKPYWEMNAEERREWTQYKADLDNEDVGHLNERDGHNCPICKNRGYITIVQEIERGEQVNDFTRVQRNCTCRSIRAAKMRMKRSGLENLIEEKTFDAFYPSEPWQKHVKDLAEKFVQEGGPVFFIGGQTGAGKTHICTAITGKMIEAGKSAYYMLWKDETTRLKGCIMDGEYQTEMQKLKNVDVLYIDDFFKPVNDQKPSGADVSLAYELINYRYNNPELITIISTERTIGEILDIDEAQGGRLVEYAGEYMINIGRDRSKNYRLRNVGMI